MTNKEIENNKGYSEAENRKADNILAIPEKDERSNNDSQTYMSSNYMSPRSFRVVISATISM